jgi:secondary thiamine-phosphate synthase enzyme
MERYSCLDLTEELERAVKDSGVTEGAAIAFCAHTTAALLLNEWEDGALEDFRARVEELVPEDTYYAHDDMERRTQNLDDANERRNGHAHVKSMLLSATSHAIPVSAGEPMLGRWQRLILFEMDDPKERQVVLHVFGE